MKSIPMVALSLALYGMSLSSPTAYAAEKVRWTGMVRDSETAHTTFHDHDLQFVRLEDGVEFDVVENEKLKALYCSTEKNYVVKVEGELTPRFLFWGGNLKVSSFEVLPMDGTSTHAHHRPEDTWPSLRSRTGLN